MQILEPDTLINGRYRVLRKIGQGGMGAVYEATDERLRNHVALKQTLVEGEQFSRAFEREAQLLAGLRHPALPRVSDHFVDESGQFLVMDFIQGDDLAGLLRQQGGPFPVARVLAWADALLDALEYLHGQQPAIIHRDIKPQNLKLTPRGEIILLDFGLAKGTAVAGQMTRTASLYGYTPQYAPLEQVQGTGTDPRSDIYSLAATLYHLLTGQAPPDVLSRAAAVLNRQEDPLRPAHEVNPEVTPFLSGALEQALALAADERFGSAAAMRRALRQSGPLVEDRPAPVTGETIAFGPRPTIAIPDRDGPRPPSMPRPPSQPAHRPPARSAPREVPPPQPVPAYQPPPEPEGGFYPGAKKPRRKGSGCWFGLALVAVVALIAVAFAVRSLAEAIQGFGAILPTVAPTIGAGLPEYDGPGGPGGPPPIPGNSATAAAGMPPEAQTTVAGLPVLPPEALTAIAELPDEAGTAVAGLASEMQTATTISVDFIGTDNTLEDQPLSPGLSRSYLFVAGPGAQIRILGSAEDEAVIPWRLVGPAPGSETVASGLLGADSEQITLATPGNYTVVVGGPESSGGTFELTVELIQ